MALVVKDRVKEVTTTTGTSNLTLGGAVYGFQSFSVIGNGNTTYYAIYDSATGDWEVGVGTYSTTGPTLTRDTVLESSNSGSKVVFGSGSKDVFVTYPAERSVYLDAAGSAVPVLDIGTLGVSTANITTANITAGTISTTPTASNDLVNKTYVDGIAAQGISYHEPVKYEVPNTTGNLNATYNNGTGGVGATLTNNGTKAAFAPDGPTASVGDRVLVYNQTNAYENGVYEVSVVGTPDPGGTNWVLTRTADADSYGTKDPNALGSGDAFFVTSGNTGAGETYVCNTAGTITFGTTAITFAQISSAQVYSAGTGLTLSNLVFSITPVGTASTYGSASSVPVFTTNASGQVTSVTNTAISIGAGAVTGLAPSATTDTTNASNITSGTLGSARLAGSYTGITGVGTLTAGTWTANTIGAAYGGTGLTTFAQGDLIYATSSSTLGRLADVATGNALISGGVGGDPAWGKIGLQTHVDGTLQVTNGGTGATTASGARSNLGLVIGTDIPSVTGSGASGTWGINITGNAATATTATTSTTATSVSNSVTFNNSGTGAASGNGFNGSSALTVSYNTIGAPSTTGTNASGTWGISISGNAATATSATSATTATTATNWGSYGAVPAAGTSFGNANTIGRSDANGYTYFYYINSNTPNSEAGTINQLIYTNGSDNFYRKAGISAVTSAVQSNASGTWNINITGSAGSAPGYLPLSGGTMTGNITVSSTSVGAQFGNLSIGYGGAFNTVQTKDGSSELFLNYSSTGNITLGVGGGYTTINQSTRSPIFYDSSNTNYYLDPASTSVLNSAYVFTTFLRRENTTQSGISWYSPSYTAWSTYMSPAGAGGSGPTGNITAPSGTLVTTWALRNFIENIGGYGWTWESGSGTGQPSVVAEIRSSDGSAQFNGSVRSPIFYDSDNTGYYVDPASTSNLYVAQLLNGKWYPVDNGSGNSVDIYVRPDNNNTYVWRHIYGGTGTGYGTGVGGYGIYAQHLGGNYSLLFNPAGFVTAPYSSRSPIFYDSDNTGYYVDANNTSVLNVIRGSTIQHSNGNTAVVLNSGTYLQLFDPSGGVHAWFGNANDPGNYFNNTTHYFRNNSSTNQFIINDSYGEHVSSLRAPIFYDSNNTSYYVDPASTSVVNVLRGSTIQHSNSNTAIVLDSPTYLQLRDPSGNTRVFLGNSGDQANYYDNNGHIFRTAGSSNVFTIDSGGVAQAIGDMRAPIFYDRNDTNYYVDPNADVSFRTSGYMATYRNDTQSVLASYNTSAGSPLQFNIYHSYGDVVIRNYRGWIYEYASAVQTDNSYRAPIFYDSNNTGYYVDPNGTSYCNNFTANNGSFYGATYFYSNLGGYSGSLASPALQAYATGGNSAFMSFHRSGNYAVNMGLDADNVLRIGGWSAPANLLQMDMGGNLTMAGNVTAYSDERLKKDWADLSDDFIERLATVKAGTYTRTDSGMRQAGSSAQDWKELLPEVVSEDAAGTLGLAYGNAAVVACVELAKSVVALRAEINALRGQ